MSSERAEDKSLSDGQSRTMVSVVTRSPEETFTLGEALGAAAEPNTVVCLYGELGSGKTKLTQGIASGLAVPDDYAVTSPTFTYINEYPGRLFLYHVDLYRISCAEELFDLGWEEYITGDGITVVEWAERAGGLLPKQRVDVRITVTGDHERRFKFVFVPVRHESMRAAVAQIYQKIKDVRQ